MAFSIRLTEEERNLADSYAKLHSMSMGEAFKRALFERIEDEYDVAVANEAYEIPQERQKEPPDRRTLERHRSMSYDVQTTQRFDREFKKLDRYTQLMIRSWINKNLVECADPRIHGKPLVANRKGQWRYRIGDYRLICLIDDHELIILALSVGHRREAYRN